METEELISECIKQNRKAQQKLYDLNYDMMMRVALFYCKNETDAENAVMESFMSVFKNIQKFKGDSKLSTWIRKIVVNKSISLYRNTLKRNARERLIEIFDHVHIIDSKHDLIDEIEADYILKQVQELPDTERIVFTLYVLDGYSHKEIGQQLNFSDSTSRWHYLNARKKLQIKLSPELLKKTD